MVEKIDKKIREIEKAVERNKKLAQEQEIRADIFAIRRECISANISNLSLFQKYNLITTDLTNLTCKGAD